MTTEREDFEALYGPMGFDLTQQTLAVPEPWSEYASEATGYAWAGYQAGRAARRAEAAKSERRARMFSSALHNNILAMQSAFIDYSLTDPQAGMQWIFNTLIGPELLPNIDVARAIGGAQAWFDVETAKEAARLVAIDAAVTKDTP